MSSIRPVRIQDVEPGSTAQAVQVGVVYRDAWRDTFGHLLGPDLVGDDELVQRGALSVHAPMCLVAAVAGGPVVGFASGAPDTGLLDRLYVVPHDQGHGVGSALLVEVTKRLAAHGAVPRLWVWEGNDDAKAFYSRHGWAHCDEERVANVGGVLFSYEQWCR